ncbi:hypothetical protein [uncultured Maricaulis sp.]|uniref:hypothetical protein n=1 Tax=uncultured Maricaulis sp. TaxID=174710 RepID=UPI0030D7CB19|tara:strand:- start:24554 stop:24757 length:204 start_codon:yes stop_codon:yes gene_type:complete
MKYLRPILLLALLAPALSGCVVIGATALVADVALGTAGAAVKTVGAVGGAAVDLVLPDSDDDSDDNR